MFAARTVFAWLCAGGLAFAAPTHTVYRTGSAEDARPASVRPGLLLAGGGGDVDEAFRWLLSLAPGGDVVVLRASGADGYNAYLHGEIGGVNSVTSIVFHTAEAARDPDVLAALARAEIVFLAGGDQARYVSFWRDGPVGAALNAHAAAGKPLGGTSAGLAVLGEHYFSADRDTITSAEALRDPFDPKVTLGTDFLSLPALRGVLTDSHFSERERLGRLIVFLARLGATAPGPVAGLGLDEATALCVEADGTARVVTARAGRAWLVRITGTTARLEAGRPLSVSGVEVTGLGPDSRLHLPGLAVTGAAERRTVAVIDGRLTDSP